MAKKAGHSSGLPEYKKRFIDFLLANNALRIGPDFTLKSKRISPWFVNIGDFNDGESTGMLGQFYADAILNSEIEPDLLYGIPEKGSALVVATAVALAKSGKNIPWFFTRKVAKDYGEATNLTSAEHIKALVVGRAPKDSQTIIQLDDVFTAGDAKYEARKVLDLMGDFRLPLLVIAVDRQEVGISASGESAIEEYEKQTGTKVVSIVNAVEIYTYLREKITESPNGGLQFHTDNYITSADLDRMLNYLRVYGTDAVREALGKIPEQRIIERDRSVIPACDMETIEDFHDLVNSTADVEGVGAYKVGFDLALGYGLSNIVDRAKTHSIKPIIYDHQKACTDIPDVGKNFVRRCKSSRVDAIIFFPQSGPETERAWIFQALDQGMNVIIGGRMTHPAYSVSEGGFITDEGAMDMYRIAARIGINNYVVPGNKPEVITAIKELIEAEGVKPVFYSPGLVAQGGNIADAAKAAGDNWHGIVGRGIVGAEDRHAAAIEHTSQL